MGSVNDEITRIAGAKTAIKNAIEDCGVDVNDTYTIDTYDDYIRAIPSAVFSQFNVDTIGGTDQFIQSIKQTNGLIEATVGGLVSISNSGLVPKAGGSAGVINNQSDDYVLTYKEGTIDWYKLPANAFKNYDNITYTLSGALNGNAYDVTLTPSSGSATGAKVPAMGAASSSAAGTAGLVPAPAKNQHNSFLRGDGTWTALPSLSVTDSESGNAVTDVKVSGHGITLKRETTFSVKGHKHSSDDITALTSYVKETAASAIASTDSLNTALGKLELKADTAYTLTAGAYDGDGTIENLAEILKVLEGISDTDTIQAIIGKYLPLAGGTMTGTITSQNIIPTTNNTYSLGRPSLQWTNVYATTFTGNLDGNAASATKLGSSTLGSTTKPIYLSGGTATECNTYAGGTAVTLNESSKASTTASFYAPTSVGPAGYLLKSNGSGAPSWTSTLGASNSYLSTSYIRNMYANALYLKSCYPTSGDIYISGFTTAPNSSDRVQLYTARYATIKNNNSSSTCAIYAPGGFYESSDERLKNISNPLQVNLDDIAKLRKIYYTWKDSPNGNQIGVIAQDVQKLYPELVDVDKETGLLSLAYDKLSVIALAAIDTLYDKIKTLEEKIDILWRK